MLFASSPASVARPRPSPQQHINEQAYAWSPQHSLCGGQTDIFVNMHAFFSSVNPLQHPNQHLHQLPLSLSHSLARVRWYSPPTNPTFYNPLAPSSPSVRPSLSVTLTMSPFPSSHCPSVPLSTVPCSLPASIPCSRRPSIPCSLKLSLSSPPFRPPTHPTVTSFSRQKHTCAASRLQGSQTLTHANSSTGTHTRKHHNHTLIVATAKHLHELGRDPTRAVLGV